MKFVNLVDAVTGRVFEGKSYKKGDDEEVLSKKEKDQERKDAAKQKKAPVDEAMGDGMTDAAKIKTLRGLIKKCKEAAIEYSDKPAKSAQYEKQVAKYEKELAELKAKGKKVPMTEGVKEQSTVNLRKRRLAIALHMEDLQAANDAALEGQSGQWRRMAMDDDDFRFREDKISKCRGVLMVLDGELARRKSSEEVVQDGVFEDDEDHAGSLDEAYGRGWSILPATVALYGKKVVDIYTAASEWKSEKYHETILVCSKNENGRERMLFIASSGDGRAYYKVGMSSETYHDQTGASKGTYTIENIVVFLDGEIIHKDNEKGLTGKASVAVFK
jgi:hypothetical protein